MKNQKNNTPQEEIIINQTIDTLKSGGVILYPTDTIWGIGCDATNPEAIQKVFDIKKRASDKALITLVSNYKMLYNIFSNIPENAYTIWELSDKPTTLILDNPRNVSEQIISSDKALGVRIVKEGFCYKLIEKFKKPIVSTSANISGMPSPTCFDDITTEIRSKVDYIVELNTKTIMNKPSTIIKLTLDNRVTIIRK
ncbi:MAG: L-threonylcarbamoyladenylate synthase [Bacteroidota bacterium]|nr:L-threonylcarbamoyladenylate synthase [Bacteroidota bacterium]